MPLHSFFNKLGTNASKYTYYRRSKGIQEGTPRGDTGNIDKAQVIKKEWLKSSQVMDILNISPGTLQRFRQNGTLSFTKIGGLIFYEAGQIEKILTDNHVKNTKRKR